MPKLRVYQLARELNRDNSEIIRELQHMGVPVTSHSNTVEDRLADALRKKLGVLETAEKVAAPPPVEEVKVEEKPAPAPVEKPVEKVAAPPMAAQPPAGRTATLPPPPPAGAKVAAPV